MKKEVNHFSSTANLQELAQRLTQGDAEAIELIYRSCFHKLRYYGILILFAGIIFNSCEKDLLDKIPQDQISDPEFWNSEADLELFINTFYREFEGWLERGSGFSPMHDASTDIVILDHGAVGAVESEQMDGNNDRSVH